MDIRKKIPDGEGSLAVERMVNSGGGLSLTEEEAQTLVTLGLGGFPTMTEGFVLLRVQS